MAIKILIYNTKRSQFAVDTRNASFFLFILTHPNKELSAGRSASHFISIISTCMGRDIANVMSNIYIYILEQKLTSCDDFRQQLLKTEDDPKQK